MDESWDSVIRRAEHLAAAPDATASLLRFYARLLRSQKAIHESLCERTPEGGFDRDLPRLLRESPVLLREVADAGPETLAAEARSLLQDDRARLEQLLLTYWHSRSDTLFFAKALLQPYAAWLAQAGIKATTVAPLHSGASCPQCGGSPQLSFLTAGSAAGDIGSRKLLCASCLNAWAFVRVRCPKCGEADERKLGYFQSQTLDYVRVDACDTCRHYLKTIDLGRRGLAVPLVDEVYAAPLDAWAREQGYEKIELNLVGL